MQMNANTLALLPEGIMTVAGVAVMMLEPVLPPKDLAQRAGLAGDCGYAWRVRGRAGTSLVSGRRWHSRETSRWTRSQCSSTC